ncbi:cell surface A33 antigen-like [Colossoma macropomum]|uniref:cell surface A33 antigen-like n=1 Tax=Colossoma macropomum TaxID=42526 RepID=UPI0018649C51|nr:cell surface A33 antigen-like [Colossoma macropomum]
MLLTFYLLFIGLHVSEGCTLKDSQKTLISEAHKGESVLLPCSCTDLHTKPEGLKWMKYYTKSSTWEEISSESGQFRNRVQLVNGHSPGNLSLLISHLTEEDRGDYQCNADKSGYLYVSLYVKVCSLENSGVPLSISAHTGGSVLLPCYCTDQHTKPERFTWNKLNITSTTWEVISTESGQYRNRVQLVNGHSPGNLSLLISHLIEEDDGWYKCDLGGSEQIVFNLTVTVCSLENCGISLSISAHTGGSVLLPCYCIDQQTKPDTFTWKKLNITSTTWDEISSESGQYRNRVQLVNGHSPGNLSLLISHLTEEDGGWYKCDLGGSEHIVLKLTVIVSSQSLPFVPFALVTVIFLHIIVAVVYHTKRNKDPARVHYSTADGDGVVRLE